MLCLMHTLNREIPLVTACGCRPWVCVTLPNHFLSWPELRSNLVCQGGALSPQQPGHPLKTPSLAAEKAVYSTFEASRSAALLIDPKPRLGLDTQTHRRPTTLGWKDTPATVIVTKENERNRSLVRRALDTHEPVLLVATMIELRNAYAARGPNPLVNKGAQRPSRNAH